MRSPAAFRWPEDCSKLEEIKRRREGATVVSPAVTERLKDLGIFREKPEEVSGGERLQGEPLLTNSS